jgi:hypothetical protein
MYRKVTFSTHFMYRSAKWGTKNWCPSATKLWVEASEQTGPELCLRQTKYTRSPILNCYELLILPRMYHTRTASRPYEYVHGSFYLTLHWSIHHFTLWSLLGRSDRLTDWLSVASNLEWFKLEDSSRGSSKEDSREFQVKKTPLEGRVKKTPESFQVKKTPLDGRVKKTSEEVKWRRLQQRVE